MFWRRALSRISEGFRPNGPPVPDREMQKTDRRSERRARRERSRRHSREASASGGFRNRAKAYRMTTFDGCTMENTLAQLGEAR